MAIQIELPGTLEERLRAEVDLDAVGRESLLVELYRQGRISHGVLAEALGMSRYQTDDVLKRHHVTEDLLTGNELAEQVTGLRGLLGQ